MLLSTNLTGNRFVRIPDNLRSIADLSLLHQGSKLMQRELFDQVACEGKYDMLAGSVRREE